MAQKEAHPTTTSTEQVAPGEHGGGFPPFQKETFASQLVWLVIAFVVLYLLISRIAVPRIGGIFDERSKRIADDVSAAQKAKDESEAAVAAYEKALAEARSRAQAIASETRDALAAEAETKRKALEGALNAKLAEAETQIAKTKADAMANVRTIAVDTAGAIVERLIGSAPPAATVAAAVDDALKR